MVLGESLVKIVGGIIRVAFFFICSTLTDAKYLLVLNKYFVLV